MARKKNTTQQPGETWWDQQVEAPRSDLPSPDKATKRAKRYRRIIWATVILAPISMFTNFAFFASAGSGPAAVATGDSAYADTRPTAMVAVRRWLSSEHPGIPTGQLVSWDGATTKKFTPVKNSGDTPYEVQTHHLTIVDAAGTLYDTTVVVIVDDIHGPVALGQPTVIPVAPSDTSWEADPYPGVETAVVSDTAEAAITQWASDYTTRTPEEFRTSIGDPNAEHYYLPLNGASFGPLTLGEAYRSPVATTEPGVDDPDYVFVEVTTTIFWTKDPVPDGTDEEPSEVTYTLLVANANTGAAKVVAWGGAGTGLTLKPYSNATPREVVLAGNNLSDEGTVIAPEAATGAVESTDGPDGTADTGTTNDSGDNSGADSSKSTSKKDKK